MLQHARSAARGHVDNPAKFSRLREILSLGLKVTARVVASGLTNEQACALERQRIAQLGPEALTNILHGVVSQREAVRLHARAALAMMKPFPRWVLEMSDEQWSAVQAHPEGASGFYADSRTFWANMVEGA